MLSIKRSINRKKKDSCLYLYKRNYNNNKLDLYMQYKEKTIAQIYNVSLVDVFNKPLALSVNFLENVRISGVLTPVIGGGGNCGKYNL